MNLPEINKNLMDTGIQLPTNQLGNDLEVVGATKSADFEGLYKLSIVTVKNKTTGELKKQLVWGLPVRGAVVPIVINNNGINYFLLVSQSRFVFGGKVSIEVNRGYINNSTVIDESLLWNYLIERKLPYLKDYADVVKVVDLGSYTAHPDLNTYKIPLQLVFAKTKENFNIDELKTSLRVKHDYYNEPKTGPPLHNTQPTLRSFDEINARLDEIFDNPDATKEEFYLNDSFSMVSISLALEHIKKEGSPF